MNVPQLENGWHHFALVSHHTGAHGEGFSGTKICVDEWNIRLDNVYFRNEFYLVGNDTNGKCPFGLL